jgi:small-conductance mechanosensitive channel
LTFTNPFNGDKLSSLQAIYDQQRRIMKWRWITFFVAIVTVLIVVAGTVIAAIYIPQIAVYIPILAVGLALALQKYTASFIAYFMIIFTKLYDLGDRIRISNVKGDVRNIGVLHTTLEEVGEDEKLGGELTGRLLHIPNLIFLDSPILNYSKEYSVHYTTISSDYMFDAVRIPVSTESNIQAAIALLEEIIKRNDEIYVKDAETIFKNGYPKFLSEAINDPRVQIYIEPQRIWIQGKFVAPLRGRNELRSLILEEFVTRIKEYPDIKLA